MNEPFMYSRSPRVDLQPIWNAYDVTFQELNFLSYWI